MLSKNEIYDFGIGYINRIFIISRAVVVELPMCYSSLVKAFLDHKLPVPLQKVYGVVLKPADRTVRMWSFLEKNEVRTLLY